MEDLTERVRRGLDRKKMKQGTSGSSTHTYDNNSSSSNSLPSLFVDEEIEVSAILLDLPNLISESECQSRFPSCWGSKRRRSGLDLNPSPAPVPSPLSPSLHKTCPHGDKEKERRPKVKVEATSPATPLSFSPSESDDKSKHSSRRNSKKRRKEEWLEIIGGLTQRRELLRGEIETVRNYYNKLKAFNLKLRAKKQELSSCLKIEKPHMEMTQMAKGLNIGMESGRHYQISMDAHEHGFIRDHSAYTSQPQITTEKFQYPHGQQQPFLLSGSGLGSGPLGIPDLNVSAEETFGMDTSQPLDKHRALTESRAKAAEARKKRMIKMKETKNNAAFTLKLARCR